MLIVSTLGCGKTTVAQCYSDFIDLDVFIKKDLVKQAKYLELIRELIESADKKGLTVLMNMKWFLILTPDWYKKDVKFYFPKTPRSKVVYDREINKIGKERTEQIIRNYEMQFSMERKKAQALAVENSWKFIELEDNQFLGDIL